MRISIITINYNDCIGLERTILSIIHQTYTDFEFVVIDGGSNDGSVDIIQKYKSNIDFWISEHDNGIYSAMNKGVKAASGDICIFMNSGDCFENSHSIEWALPYLKDDSICVGRTVLTMNGKIHDYYSAPDNPTLLHFLKAGLHHQSAFIPRCMLLDRPYDEKLRIFSDWKHFVQNIVIDNCPYISLPVTISSCDMEGVSFTMNKIALKERKESEELLIPERVLRDYRNTESNNIIRAFLSRLVKYVLRRKRVWDLKRMHSSGLPY